MISLALNLLLMKIFSYWRISINLTTTISLVIALIMASKIKVLTIMVISIILGHRIHKSNNSKEVIIEGNIGVILLIVHDVPEAVNGHLHADSVDVILVPLVVALAQGLEIIVALGKIVARYVGVEMMDMVVFDAAAEEFQEESEGEISTALEGCTSVTPLFGS